MNETVDKKKHSNEKKFQHSKHVITYDLEKSLKNNKIEMSTIIRIEQTAIPKAALILPSDVSKKFNIANNSTVLMSNDQLKLKIYSLPDFVLLHTFIGPIFDGCIIKMEVNYYILFVLLCFSFDLKLK
jgi:hypothetical protein